MTRKEVLEEIRRCRAVAVVRLRARAPADEIAAALAAGGIRILELTLTTPNALQTIEALRAGSQDVVVGAGSVLTESDARNAIDAGAQFVVGPVVNERVIALADSSGVAVMPGAFTPTEIQRAHELGADVVKVFPADVLGMQYFRSVLAPMPHLRLMPTGGVSLDNAGDWLRAGAWAVGVGSALVDQAAVEAGDFATLTRNAKRLMESIEPILASLSTRA
jgi:2-dehydro-3-deoxyphosphogluconate aldolase/(4S)-4-hydroxy-2-oxoglutarate aldolase